MEHCGPCDGDTIQCAGHREVLDIGWEPEVTLVASGFMTDWKGTLPRRWFYYNSDWGFEEIAKRVEVAEYPLVGKCAVIVWDSVSQNLGKCKLLSQLCLLVEAVKSRNDKAHLFFVTHPPVVGMQKFDIIKYNNNLMFGVHLLRRQGMLVHSIAIHHWCLRQGKRWENVAAIEAKERNVLVFLIMSEVLDTLGLAV